MSGGGGWSVNLKATSTATLVELYQLLKGSTEQRPQALAIQKELVERARLEGLTTEEILGVLVVGVGTRNERAAIAKEWCEALGLTADEARRLAG